MEGGLTMANPTFGKEDYSIKSDTLLNLLDSIVIAPAHWVTELNFQTLIKAIRKLKEEMKKVKR